MLSGPAFFTCAAPAVAYAPAAVAPQEHRPRHRELKAPVQRAVLRGGTHYKPRKPRAESDPFRVRFHVGHDGKDIVMHWIGSDISLRPSVRTPWSCDEMIRKSVADKTSRRWSDLWPHWGLDNRYVSVYRRDRYRTADTIQQARRADNTFYSGHFLQPHFSTLAQAYAREIAVELARSVDEDACRKRTNGYRTSGGTSANDDRRPTVAWTESGSWIYRGCDHKDVDLDGE